MLLQFFTELWEWTLENLRIVLPVLLVICALVTAIAVVSRGQARAMRSGNSVEEIPENAIEVPEVELELNAVPELNALFNDYFTAMAEGDMETLRRCMPGLTEADELRVRAISDYIERYSTVDVYSKPGPINGSYVCFVYDKVRFKDYSQDIPGIRSMYVCTDDEGRLFINTGTVTREISTYIDQISLQDDVVDLNNQVNFEFNDLVASDDDLKRFIERLTSEMNVSIGKELAAAAGEQGAEAPEAAEQAPETAEEGEGGAQADQQAGPAGTSAGVRSAIVQESVILRGSASTEGDNLGTLFPGAMLTVQEELQDGWARVLYGNKEGYVRTEYLSE